MKAQIFLNLVGELLTTQQDYFKAKRSGSPAQYDLLIKSKGLEKRAMAVVREGRLEPDDVVIGQEDAAAMQANLFTGEDHEATKGQ
jgi:hypothetical protein